MRRNHAGLLRSSTVLGAALLVALFLPTSGPVASTPLAHREVLPNGIVLLVSHRPAVPIVAARAYVQGAGAAFDPPDRQGLANLTGALLSRGTATRSATQLDAAIEFVGGSLETGVDRDGLVVAVDVLSKDISLGLDLLSEVLLSPAFPEDELARKVKEIQAAIQRAEESPDGLAARALRRLVFSPHPYAWPVEGTRESVAKVTHADVVGFYQGHVRPDTTIITVVGAVSRDAARREILARLGRWARPAAPAPELPMVSAGGPPRTEAIKRDLAQSTVLMGRQAIRQTDPDYFALAVASYILGGGSSSRLYDRVREQEGLAYSVWSDVGPARYGAWLTVGAQTRAAAALKVSDLLRDELARMGREPVSDRELELAKAYLIGSFPLRLDTTAKVASFITASQAQGLGLDYADRYRQGVTRVTTADVQRVSARFFAPNSFNRVVVGQSP
ncbi:MAG: M16 family metallopeptidase [Candidatus Rokuibacteriota bacterium]